MADSFFGFDTSLSNLNDDEGGGEGSEEEYDALNDETFGHGNDEFDWEVEHEHLAHQLESSRRNDAGIDDLANSQLEASLSQLVLDETDAPHLHTIGSSVWRHDPLPQPPPLQPLKNVCTVEELERQIRQKQTQQQNFNNFFQPRFPVILQRPPGLQGPLPLPFAPQQQMNQSLNKLLNQPPITNHMSNHVGMGQNVGQMGQGVGQMGQNVGQMGQNVGQMGQNVGQMGQNIGQMPQNQMSRNKFMQNNQFPNHHGQMTQNMHQIGQNQMMPNQIGQNMNMGQSHNQMQQNMGQMTHSMNHVGQNSSHNMGQMPNGGQFGQMGQYNPIMGQNRMMAPPPGMNMPIQNYSSNMNQYNHNFRGPVPKSNDQPQQNMILNQQMLMKNQQQMNIQHNHQNNQNTQQMNQMGANVNQMGSVNQMGANVNQMGSVNQMGANVNSMGPNLNSMGANVNQMGNLNQMGQNMSQSPQKGLKDQKKTRVFNNKNQNLTSQNLVQLIQSTHPMLQFNSYHNANHHPMLNRNGQFNNLNQNFVNQRQMNGVFNNTNNGSNNRSILTDEESLADCDEYAGLMTQREKQWLINIQMLQLNTGTPYIHDFYYTVFLERQAKKEKEGVKEAHKVNQQNHPFYSGGVKQETQRRERHNSNRHNSTSEDAPRTYVPTQFENSLGKLQCGSVTAPRKIIDVEVVGEQQTQRHSRAPSVASTSNPAEVPRELKRTKQLLLDIEALYLILLRLEELNDPLAISNALILKEREEKQKQLEAAQKEIENDNEDESNVFLKNIESVQRRPKQDSPKSETIDKRQVVNLAVVQKPAPVKNLLDEDKDDLINKMFMGLLMGEKLAQMLTVRKGRSLVNRFVSRVCTDSRCRWVWARCVRHLPALARRPDDGSLAALSVHYARYIESTSSWSPVLESCGLLSEALDPARTPYCLTTSFTLSCVCALIEKASFLINTLEATANERQWSKFLKTLARALKNTSLNVARPLKPLPENKLTYHLKQIESRNTIEILQRGKPADFADLTKNDVLEQLVKHLC